MLNLFPFGAAIFFFCFPLTLFHNTVCQCRTVADAKKWDQFTGIFKAFSLSDREKKQTNNRLHNPNRVGKTNKRTKSVIVFMFTVFEMFSFFFRLFVYVYVKCFTVSFFCFSIFCLQVDRSRRFDGS